MLKKEERRVSVKDILRTRLSDYGIYFAFIIMLVLFSTLSPVFLKIENVLNILRQVANIGIISVGMALVIITGGIDLSVGSTVGFSAVLSAYLMIHGFHPVVAIIITLLAGTLAGFTSAFFINHLEIPPFVVTLSMMTILRGIGFILTKGIAIYGFSKGFKQIGQGYVGPLPIPVIIVTAIFIFGYLLLACTKYGRYAYGIGGNEEAARLSGVSPKKIKVLAYSLLGFLSSMSGIVLLARVNSGNPNLGTGYELDAISACILGGVSISGGSGKITGVVVGVLFLGVLTNGLILLNINEFLQMLVKGAVLLAAVSLDKIAQRQKQKIIVVEED